MRLWSRLGNEKTAQFPEIVAALKEWAQGLKVPLVIDGEIRRQNQRGVVVVGYDFGDRTHHLRARCRADFEHIGGRLGLHYHSDPVVHHDYADLGRVEFAERVYQASFSGGLNEGGWLL